MENNGAAISPRILYLDTRVAVVYKNIGEVCENGAADRKLSLVENLREELERLAGKKLPELEAAHRIDQPVTGCVVLALDKDALASLSRQFADGTVRKKYLAIVERKSPGGISQGGRLEHLIFFDTKHHKATAALAAEVRSPGPDWKKASLEWKLEGMGEKYAFVSVMPETGRTHQIRAQFAAADMPIKGDLKYGARRSDPLGGIRLHSWTIQFRQPETGDVITVKAPIIDPDNLWKAFALAVS